MHINEASNESLFQQVKPLYLYRQSVRRADCQHPIMRLAFRSTACGKQSTHSSSNYLRALVRALYECVRAGTRAAACRRRHADQWSSALRPVDADVYLAAAHRVAHRKPSQFELWGRLETADAGRFVGADAPQQIPSADAAAGAARQAKRALHVPRSDLSRGLGLVVESDQEQVIRLTQRLEQQLRAAARA